MTDAFSQLKTDYHFDTENNVIVSSVHQRIAEIINDYNPELTLMWIPPGKRDEIDEHDPFVIVHTMANGSQYPVMWIPLEQMDNPQIVLGRLFAGDAAKAGGADRIEKATEAAEKADQIYRAKVASDRWDERMEFLDFALKTPLHTFKHDGKKYGA